MPESFPFHPMGIGLISKIKGGPTPGGPSSTWPGLVLQTRQELVCTIRGIIQSYSAFVFPPSLFVTLHPITIWASLNHFIGTSHRSPLWFMIYQIASSLNASPLSSVCSHMRIYFFPACVQLANCQAQNSDTPNKPSPFKTNAGEKTQNLGLGLTL